MVRTLSAIRTPPKGQSPVLLPGATEAEPWEMWTLGASPECLAICQKPAENRFRGETILALPAAQVFCLPLWLNETDAGQFRGIILLQLEARGLRPRTQEPIFNWSVIAQESARTLVLVAVLPVMLPEELETETCRSFDVAARFFSLPTDALVLWREQDRLVAALTRAGQLAYFQALAEATLSPRVLQDLSCLKTALQMQDVINEPKQIVLWTEAPAAEVAGLEAAFALTVRTETRPAPRLPGEPWNLTPPRVDEVKRGRVARRWQLRGLGLVVFCLLVMAAVLGSQLFLTSLEVGRLQHWKVAHAPALQQVHDTQAAWKDLQPVVDESGYPLELLRAVSASVPIDQLHLILFEAEPNHLLIKGEAKNLTAAFQLLDALKKDPQLTGYTWEMAQPHSLANDVTQLQIEGNRATHD